MAPSPRRGPRARLALISAALASVIAGYYLGQLWQRRALDDVSAVVYPSGKAIEYPAGLAIGHADGAWRLFLSADTRVARCASLLRHLALVLNRLAVRPEIQQRLRVTVLAHDRPDAAQITAFTGGATWVEVVGGEPSLLDRLSAQLGIRPGDGGWCSGDQATTILVSPDRTAWALIPQEQAAIMARNIGTIIDFVE